MEKICPRCGARFECLHNENMAACQCVGVVLTAEQREYLGRAYADCLCRSCLEHIRDHHTSPSEPERA